MEIYYKFRKEFVMENKTVEKLVEENKNNMVTTTQLRQLLSNSVIVKNKISSNVLKKVIKRCKISFNKAYISMW